LLKAVAKFRDDELCRGGIRNATDNNVFSGDFSIDCKVSKVFLMSWRRESFINDCGGPMFVANCSVLGVVRVNNDFVRDVCMTTVNYRGIVVLLKLFS
jgi:hypothetical protein